MNDVNVQDDDDIEIIEDNQEPDNIINIDDDLSDEELPCAAHQVNGLAPLKRSARSSVPPSRLNPVDRKSYNMMQIVTNPDQHLKSGACMIQLSLAAGIKKYDKRAISAINQELRQLHLRKTFIPVHQKNLKKDEKEKILESHLLAHKNLIFVSKKY